MQSILLLGFPNSGKSSLFNLLSGMKRATTNYSGATVTQSTGHFLSNSEFLNPVAIIDLPGIYHLNPRSLEEAETVTTLLKNENYHGVAAVVDIERIEASLSLAMELKEVIGDRLVLLLNKDDQGKFKTGLRKELENLTGLRVLSTSSKYGNIRELDRFLRDSLSEQPIRPLTPIRITPLAEPFFLDKGIDKDFWVSVSEGELLGSVRRNHEMSRMIVKKWLVAIDDSTDLTKKIDAIIMHKYFGGLIFCAVFYFIFLAIYQWSGPLMDLIDAATALLGKFLGEHLSDGQVKSLLIDGVIAGVGGVIIFLPQIMILFFLFSLLEQSGYIARAAVVTDRMMAIFGLNGRAFLPYLSGFACSIPGIMSARTIPDKKERLATIMTIPLITCSARLPVYILLIGTFVPNTTIFGVFNSQALSFFFLFFLGSMTALIIAKIFRLSSFKGKSSSFFMPLPKYALPSLKMAWNQSWGKGKVFLMKAGTTILGLSIIIWFLSSYPRFEVSKNMPPSMAASLQLEHSTMGTLGKFIEPILKPIGMDWKMGIGLISAFGARELFVSTMGTIYALGDVDEDSTTLRERLINEKNPETGAPRYLPGTVWSLLIFFVFALQCMSTLAVMKRELGGWRLPLIATSYMGVLAYLGAFITYRLLAG